MLLLERGLRGIGSSWEGAAGFQAGAVCEAAASAFARPQHTEGTC